jgi:hypothetical protein
LPSFFTIWNAALQSVALQRSVKRAPRADGWRLVSENLDQRAIRVHAPIVALVVRDFDTLEREGQMAGSRRLTADDRLDIIDLMARYARCLDSGDLDGYVNNFAPDGVLFGMHKGHAQIRAYVADLIAKGDVGPQPNGEVRVRHFVDSPVIDGEGDRATVRAYLFWVTRDSPSPVSVTSEITCEVVKLNGRWVFESRLSKLVAGQPPVG